MKTTCRKSWPGNLFQLLTLTFDPSSVSNGVILLQRPYIFLSSHILLILRREITAVAVALCCYILPPNMYSASICLFIVAIRGHGHKLEGFRRYSGHEWYLSDFELVLTTFVKQKECLYNKSLLKVNKFI